MIVTKKHKNRRGVLAFEWILITTLLIIGLVGGLAAIRDATNIKMADVGSAIGNIGTDYNVPAYTPPGGATPTAPAMSHEATSVTISLAPGE